MKKPESDYELFWRNRVFKDDDEEEEEKDEEDHDDDA